MQVASLIVTTPSPSTSAHTIIASCSSGVFPNIASRPVLHFAAAVYHHVAIVIEHIIYIITNLIGFKYDFLFLCSCNSCCSCCCLSCRRCYSYCCFLCALAPAYGRDSGRRFLLRRKMQNPPICPCILLINILKTRYAIIVSGAEMAAYGASRIIITHHSF